MKRNVKIGLVVALLIGTGFGVVSYLNYLKHRGKVAVIVRVSPSDAEVTIDGHRFPSGKTVYLEPKRYTFKAARQYFEEASSTMEVTMDNKVREVVLILGAESNEAKAFLIDHPSEQTLRESLGGKLANEQGEAARNKTPLVELLPFIDREFRIDYGPSVQNPDDPTAIAITITSTSESSKQEALNWIKFKGYDPAVLEMIYKNF